MYSLLNYIVIWRCWSLKFFDSNVTSFPMHNSFSLCSWCCVCNRIFGRQMQAEINNSVKGENEIRMDGLAEEILSMSQCFVLYLVKWRQKPQTTVSLKGENDISSLKIIHCWCHAVVAFNYFSHHISWWFLNVLMPWGFSMWSILSHFSVFFKVE